MGQRVTRAEGSSTKPTPGVKSNREPAWKGRREDRQSAISTAEITSTTSGKSFCWRASQAGTRHACSLCARVNTSAVEDRANTGYTHAGEV